MLATFNSVPNRAGVARKKLGRGRIGSVLPFAYGPALRAVSAKHGLRDYSSSYLNACKVITRSLSPRIPRCLSSIIFCATSRAAGWSQPQTQRLANALQRKRHLSCPGGSFAAETPRHEAKIKERYTKATLPSPRRIGGRRRCEHSRPNHRAAKWKAREVPPPSVRSPVHRAQCRPALHRDSSDMLAHVRGLGRVSHRRPRFSLTYRNLRSSPGSSVMLAA